MTLSWNSWEKRTPALTFRVLEQLAQILEGMSDEQEDTF